MCPLVSGTFDGVKMLSKPVFVSVLADVILKGVFSKPVKLLFVVTRLVLTREEPVTDNSSKIASAFEMYV